MPPPGLPRPPSGRIFLGWQYAVLHPDPGPPPRRPVPPERQQLSSEWLAAQRREENMLDRPLKVTVAAAVAAGVALVILAAAGWLPMLAMAPAVAVCVVIAVFAGYAVWQGERALRGRVADEQRRVERFRAEQERRLFA